MAQEDTWTCALLSFGTYEAVSSDEEHNGPHVRLQTTQRQTD